MVEQKKTLGLLVQFSSQKDSRLLATNLFVANDSPTNKQFITTTNIRKALAQNHDFVGDLFGTVIYRSKDGETIREAWYFPIKHEPGTGPVKEFERQGIARAVDSIVSRRLKQVFPNAKRIVFNPQPKRKEHLIKAGINEKIMKEGISLEEYAILSRAKRTADLRAIRNKQRLRK
jgi:hypothetical protein